ncbi:hypothetical protein [Larkinella soli]|uniref:hypothetical protein n=1 Tax=Larkinella soli TaxID=1770527 RepID=UPI000FFB1462|nr:hypothetical protein [Larkinella soli]
MSSESSMTVVLFPGFNEVSLPQDARLSGVETDGYEVSLVFETDPEETFLVRQFYLAFNSGPTDYSQGVLRLLKSISFPDGTSTAMIYEVFPYEDRGPGW